MLDSAHKTITMNNKHKTHKSQQCTNLMPFLIKDRRDWWDDPTWKHQLN